MGEKSPYLFTQSAIQVLLYKKEALPFPATPVGLVPWGGRPLGISTRREVNGTLPFMLNIDPPLFHFVRCLNFPSAAA